MITSTRSLIILVIMLVIFTTALQPITDPDFWWHLKTGQYIVQNREIPFTDVFSNTKLGSEWIAHEWLSEVVIYAIYRVAGFGGLIVVFATLITVSFWLVYRRFKDRVGHPIVAGFALLLGAVATTLVWGVRPQIFTLLFASIFLSVLNRYYRNEWTRAIWWLAPLMILWVNMHAGFALGLTLIALTIAGLVLDVLFLKSELRDNLRQRVPPLFVLFLACGAAVSVNPNGTRMYWYPYETLTSQAMMRFIEEWKSPDFHQPHFQAVLLLLLVTFSVLALSPKRIRPGELLMLMVTAFAALRSGRNIAFFSLVATPIFGEHLWNWLKSQRLTERILSRTEEEPNNRSPVKAVLNFLLISVVLIIPVLGIKRAAAKQPLTEAQQFPAAAVNFMSTQPPPQPIYNAYAWGGYLIWRLYPNYRVYIDGRADVYGDKLVEEFIKVHDGKPGWLEVLKKRGTRTVLVEPDSALASLLREEDAWQKVFEDQQAIIFVLQN
jgi:hypothetical protein